MALIKAFVILLSLVFSSALYGQVTINKDSLLYTQNPNYRTDSFTFCNKTFKIPRDCDGVSLSNCCIAYSNNNSLLCGSENGNFMNWYYLPTLDLARQIFEGSVDAWQSTNWAVAKRQVNCYLLGVKTTSWYLEVESNNTGLKRYLIISYGTVNGKFVVAEYNTSSSITKNYILPTAFKEIIKWD